MFFQKQGRTVEVLMTIFGILLLDLYIQPAHADVLAEVKAAFQRQAKAGAQAVADPAKLSGLRCFECGPCKSNTDLGDKTLCKPDYDYCAWGEVIDEYGEKQPTRLCAPSEAFKYYSCDTFSPLTPDSFVEVRFCGCKGDLCNTKEATSTTHGAGPPAPGSGSGSSSQLILVAASLFGSLMMK